MTQSMEKLGMVGRPSDPRDARLAYVVLTAAGQRLVKDARATLERSSENLSRDLWSKREIATLAELLGRRPAGRPRVTAARVRSRCNCRP